MPRTPEYCITCGGKLRVVASFVVENHYELLSLDLDTMHGKASPEKITSYQCVPSHHLQCERCYDRQSATIEFVHTPNGDAT